MDATSLLEALRNRVPDASLDSVPALDYPTIGVDREHLIALLTTVRDDPALKFDVLAEVTAADYLPRTPRFEVVYHLVRAGHGALSPARLRVKVCVPEDSARVPTASGLFAVANWLEREVFDLYGITFDGHPDLRRLLMTDDWEGHPLRKDYPVQVNVPYRSTEAMQLTEQEFLANIERQRRATATRQQS